MTTNETVETLRLQLEQYVISLLLSDHEIDYSNNLRTVAEYRAEYVAYHIASIFRVPAKVLQDREVIARWPDGLWNTFLDTIGLGKYAKYKTVRMDEKLVFPKVPVPKDLKTDMLVYTNTRTYNERRD